MDIPGKDIHTDGIFIRTGHYTKRIYTRMGYLYGRDIHGGDIYTKRIHTQMEYLYIGEHTHKEDVNTDKISIRRGHI